MVENLLLSSQQRKRKPRLLLIHSETRSYRVPLFDALAKEYMCTFLFMEGKQRSRCFPESRHWNYKDLRPYPVIGYTNDFSPGLIRELIQRRNDIDVIISSSLASFATHSSFLIARFLNKPWILWSEDWIWSHAPLATLSRPYLQWIARSADAVIAAGTKTKEFFCSWGTPENRIFIAFNCALDLMQSDHSAQVNNLKRMINSSKYKVIAYIGRIVQYKALDVLIRAYAQLERTRDDIFLLIVGDGPDAGRCRSILETIGLKRYYWPQEKTLKGRSEQEIIPHHELVGYYQLSDVIVLPGRFLHTDHVPCESWGLVLNEALSLSKPLVSTNSVAAAYDLIVQGVNGYRIAENNEAALVEALVRIISSPNRLRVMGRASRSIFESRFQYPSMMKGFTNAIQSVWEKKL